MTRTLGSVRGAAGDGGPYRDPGATISRRGSRAALGLPLGPLFCVIDGPTCGRAWSASAARVELHHLALKAGIRRRFAPHQLRHAHAVELLREGIPLPLIQRQLGHSHLSTTGTYLEGINTEEIISTVHARRAPMMHASAGLAL
ncbi:MAG TPA: tyrosine-type recombinase/integrase [Anaeromyxobacteraceae bacterium]|nr:tyrosine-type recombinase/integrase [Anaeromyxobacteraceae bacterium]